MAYLTTHWLALLITTGSLVGAIVAAEIVHWVLFSVLRRRAAEPGHVVAASLVTHGRRPSKWVLPLIALMIAVPLVSLPRSVKNPLEHILGLGIIAVVAWACILITEVFADIVIARYPINMKDNLAERRIQTQVKVFRRIVTVVIVVVAAGIMLLTVPGVHAIGTSVLASAGLAGLVIGMAAKPTLGNLVAGVQIALTQPIRIEDAVIVEGQWGWIEEITTTYVVVRIWNWQRLVLPLTYFVETAFQNWTRNNAALIGSVYIYTDYTVPLDPLREELNRLVKTTDKWRGEVVVLQVSDANAHVIELRALADAVDAPTAWDLRCYLRENLIKFLQQNYPECLPKTRAELNPRSRDEWRGVFPGLETKAGQVPVDHPQL